MDMSSSPGDEHTSSQATASHADNHLAMLGYTSEFRREMSLWANISLGFTYLSPLVGVYSLFAYGLSLAGPPAFWWIVIVGLGQFLVALVFGEVASQFPVAGGLYQWVRRLANRKAAWLVSWVYALAMIVTVTSVAEYGGAFVAPLFGFTNTPNAGLATALALLLLALVLNFTGTRTLARVAQIGLVAELVGVIAVGVYLLVFERKNSISVLLDPMGAMGAHSSYLGAFLSAALTGLFLFYGFEACGNVAEEVSDPSRRIPSAMRLTIDIGGVSAARGTGPPGDHRGRDRRPDPGDPRGLAGLGGRQGVPLRGRPVVHLLRALAAGCSQPTDLLLRPRQDDPSQLLAGDSVPPPSGAHPRPAGGLRRADAPLRLGQGQPRSPGADHGIRRPRDLSRLPDGRLRRVADAVARLVVNVVALAYGIVAIVLLAWPRSELTGIDSALPLFGVSVVLGTGALYLMLARPDRHSTGPEGDAIEIADRLRELRRSA